MPYQVIISPTAADQIRELTARQRSMVLEGISQQLTSQPTVETRNRKLMRPNPLASWELRIGDLRVYYDVEEEPEAIVEILAVGIKDRNQVRFGDRLWEETDEDS